MTMINSRVTSGWLHAWKGICTKDKYVELQSHEALRAKSFDVENFCRVKFPLTFGSDSPSPTWKMALEKWGMW